LAQPAHKRIVRGRRSELRTGSNPCIDAQEPLLRTGGQLREEGSDRLFATLAKTGAADQAPPGAANEHHARQRGRQGSAYGPVGALAVAFAKERARFARAQAHDGRGVEGLDGALRAAEAGRFGWQVRQAPSGGPLKPRVAAERAALNDTLNAMSAPAQVRDIWQGGAGAATL